MVTIEANIETRRRTFDTVVSSAAEPTAMVAGIFVPLTLLHQRNGIKEDDENHLFWDLSEGYEGLGGHTGSESQFQLAAGGVIADVPDPPSATALQSPTMTLKEAEIHPIRLFPSYSTSRKPVALQVAGARAAGRAAIGWLNALISRLKTCANLEDGPRGGGRRP